MTIVPGPLLEVRGLSVDFAARHPRGMPVRAVDDVSLQIAAGETLGLVGESGSGKSTLGNAILGLVAPAAGQILLAGRDITWVRPRQRRELAANIQAIFQDPYGSLNPARSIGSTLAEPLRVRRGLTRAEASERVKRALERVGLPPSAAARYPGQFSGGQRQRIAIARALILEPDLVICDEPTSALDLSVQAQILNLLLKLQDDLELAYLFISHDIDVVRHLAHRVTVLFRGRVVESGITAQVFDHPQQTYTRALIAAAASRGDPLISSRADILQAAVERECDEPGPEPRAAPGESSRRSVSRGVSPNLRW
jgi:ABC-type glutathione transport system ATPase component